MTYNPQMNQITDIGRIKKIHLVGIGGSGMGGIAEVLLNKGYNVSGSDQAFSAVTERLQQLGATIFLGHNARNVENVDVVIISTAIEDFNPEVVAAHKKHIPVMPRAQMLGELMRLQTGIAVAGTHGKTTTTSLISSIFTEANLDPTFVIGGLLKSAGSNAKMGEGKYFIAEADESDASFLYLRPKMTVITNIDADHMGTYNNSFGQLKKTFLDFIVQLPFFGIAAICIDDPVIREILPQIPRPTISYGFSADAELRAIDFKQKGTKSNFAVIWRDKEYEFAVNLPGKHNVLNSLAAIAVSLECGIDVSVIQNALSKFQGVERRFEVHDGLIISGKKVLLINDYGHHPKEIAVTIQAIRDAWPGRRLVLAFEPHRYSRTRDLFNDFVTVLMAADELLLIDIYPASEHPLPGISAAALGAEIGRNSKIKLQLVGPLQNLPKILEHKLRDDDILLLQGAGTIGKMANDLVAKHA